LNPLPKLNYIIRSTKYSKGGITKRAYKNPKSIPQVESTLEPSFFFSKSKISPNLKIRSVHPFVGAKTTWSK
jgi:hypothetical protein